ncbi:MAG: class I SAM-dependent methyltransferase [Candidatus Promineifilaceae bacterium]|jgi:cephalosporin hydroxylase
MKSFIKDILRQKYRFAFNKPPYVRRILITEGILGLDEALCLHKLACEVEDGCIVEVGSYRGKSTVALATGSQQGHAVPVFAIDPHESFVGPVGGVFGPQDRSAFFSNMLRTSCAESVRLINLPSQTVVKIWSHKIGLLWLDGDHNYDAVASDFFGFVPFVVPGGYIALHDSLDKDLGPAQVIAQALETGNYEKIIQVDLTTVLQKKA